ncbi:MAG: CPBP family intramembrane glutamic endopeptidase [Victivallaceae bacterium]|jgi:membrane protease YdiL (CAAX protease family)
MLDIYNNKFTKDEKYLNRGFIAGISLLFLFYMFIPALLSGSHRLLAGLNEMPKSLMILIVCFPPPLLSLAALLIIFKFTDRRKSLFEKLGLNKWHLSNFWICVAVCVFMLGISAVTTINFKKILDFFEITCRPPAFLTLALSCDTTGFILLSIAAAIIAPVSEEILFRRVIYGFVAARIGIVGSIIFTSLLFAMIHDSFAQFPALFLLGVAFQLTYLHFHSLYPAIVLHFLNNAAAVCAILLVRIFNIPLLQ